MTTPTQAMPVQYGTAESADFEAMTWTFRMPEGFKVAAGSFAILPAIEYQSISVSDFAGQSGQAHLGALVDELRAANAALTEALKEIAGTEWVDAALNPQLLIQIARTALASVEVPK
jgi:hypothetical protein